MSLCFDDFPIGAKLPSLTKGPMSPVHIMRWSAAIENFHRIHYDRSFAVEHDKLPDILVNGSWKQHVMVQLLKDGLGPDGWLWKIQFRYKMMDVAWDTLHAHAEVIDRREIDGLGFLQCRLALLNQRDQVSTAGFAVGVVPLKGGRRPPYPFVPKPDYDVFKAPAE
ncbi:MAG: acyl dehydratase [Alphaproteobacteria bacterium]|nr:acyl dehydratase [Alphaproteobacteria bacterium]